MHRFARPFLARRDLAIVGLALVLLVAACSQAAASPPATAQPTVAATALPSPVATGRVTIANFAFSPAVITVPVGTSVTWTNQDVEEHTVTARDRAFNSDAVGNGQTFTFTFTRAGTYDYLCLIHTHMVGRVIVTAN